MSETLVFVYGTLKRGATNHAVLADQRFLGETRTPPGYRLYVVADYPGLVREPSDRRGVAGEVWAVSPDALHRLDEFEGVPQRLYRRDSIALPAPFENKEVFAYYYLRNTRGRRLLVDGIWPVRNPPPPV